MVKRVGKLFVVGGPKGQTSFEPSGNALDITHYAVDKIGIRDYEPLFDAIWALCTPGEVDELRFWWRAGDPGEMDIVRKR